MELLHFLLRTRWDPTALPAARALATRDGVDWDAWLRAARGGGVSPLLYQTVRDRDLLPPSVEEALRLDYFHNAAHNMRRFHQLERALRHLAAEGVDVVLLKGAALAEAVYGNLALRPMCDFDLLVHRDDVSTALSTFSPLGYDYPETEPSDGFRVAYWNELMLTQSGDVPVAIEIHWRLFGHLFYQYAIPTDWFWQTARPVRIGDAPTLMLGPTAQVLHLCGHMVLQHGGCEKAKPLWFHDLAEVIALYGAEIDWGELLSRARDYDLVLPVRRVLGRMSEEWRVPIPPAVLEKLRDLRPSSEEERFFPLLTGAHRPLQRYWMGLKRLPGWGLKLRYLGGTLFPSMDFMQDRYRIPHRFLSPLYYPYRWFRSLRAAR